MSQEWSTLVASWKCGDRYARSDMTRFMDTLRRLPAGYGKPPKAKDRTLAEKIRSKWRSHRRQKWKPVRN